MTRMRGGLLSAAMCMLVTATSCTGGGHSSATSSGRRCAPVFTAPFDRVDACSAESVMTAALTTVFSYRPAEHLTAPAAFTAAAPLMDPEFAARAEPAAALLVPITPVMWQQWAARAVTVTASARVTGDEHPPDTTTSVARVLAVTQRPSDNSPSIQFAVYARAGRSGPGTAWRITQLEVKT
ncbi:hypothetical protein [Nocardia vaccinii]|uniref:hypothetical protein n=1 Tax=Nocardia vaccinii TaxID=1822 RepID=UPI00082E0384|nr:hypothetical protein [Nocardia vaccinii]